MQTQEKRQRNVSLLNWSNCRKFLEARVKEYHPFWKCTQVQKDDMLAFLEGGVRGAINKIAYRQSHHGKTISLRNAGYNTVTEEKENET